MIPVTLVTQIRVRSETSTEFERWLDRLNDAVAQTPGYFDHEVIPPSPPVQVDWAIVQRFASAEAARAWLQSTQRQRMLDEAQPLVVGYADVHLVTDRNRPASAGPVSAVISTRVKLGQDDAFQRWQHRIAAAQATFDGFQGYKLEPPIRGVQDDWLVVVRFDSDAHLKAWMNSEQRRQLLRETADFDVETQVRTVRSGFESWFPSTDDAQQRPPPAWKQNMLVLLMLYPVVFLFGKWVQTPLLMERGAAPFWLALFIGNAASVTLLNWLVPWASRRFGWWLRPSGHDNARVAWTGAALVTLLYGVCLVVFAHL
jgi:antibiotic biosynthesis monooxygenase (ABM) superfamily enzyme